MVDKLFLSHSILPLVFFFNPETFQFNAQARDREKANPGGGGGLWLAIFWDMLLEFIAAIVDLLYLMMCVALITL